MICNSEPITIINLSEISYLAYDTCKNKFGEPEQLIMKLDSNIEEYVNGIAYNICNKSRFIKDVKSFILYFIENNDGKLVLFDKEVLQNELLNSLLIPYLEIEYKKVLATVKFVNRVYLCNKDKMLNVNKISKEYNKYVIMKFDLFLMLVYEFSKVRKRDLNDATYRAFEIMDIIFGNSWKYMFYNLDEFEYLDFLNKFIYSNIRGRKAFLIEFNFRGLKKRYINYLVTKIRRNLIDNM